MTVNKTAGNCNATKTNISDSDKKKDVLIYLFCTVIIFIHYTNTLQLFTEYRLRIS